MKAIIIKNKNSSYKIDNNESILERQIRLLNKFGIDDIVIKNKF